ALIVRRNSREDIIARRNVRPDERVKGQPRDWAEGGIIVPSAEGDRAGHDTETVGPFKELYRFDGAIVVPSCRGDLDVGAGFENFSGLRIENAYGGRMIGLIVVSNDCHGAVIPANQIAVVQDGGWIRAGRWSELQDNRFGS